MELDAYEGLALNLLRSQPEILNSMATNGNIEIGKIYAWFHSFDRNLGLSESKRKNEMVDVSYREVTLEQGIAPADFLKGG